MSDLTASQLQELSEHLDRQYRDIQDEVRTEFDNAGERHRIDLLNREPGDSGDLSLASALADFNVMRFDRYIQALRDIEAARLRLQNGEYGTCTDCGMPIGFARLRAYPTAKRCIDCQQKHEREYAQAGRHTL
jgi:RNA polymerase-binding protein DksA